MTNKNGMCERHGAKGEESARRLFLADQAQIGFGNGLVDAVPAEIEAARFAGGAVARAQGGVDDIGAQRFGKGMDRAGADQPSIDVIFNEAFAAVASAATTGRAQAIASSVTLPKVSVIDGLNSTSIEATARPRSAPP